MFWNSFRFFVVYFTTDVFRLIWQIEVGSVTTWPRCLGCSKSFGKVPVVIKIKKCMVCYVHFACWQYNYIVTNKYIVTRQGYKGYKVHYWQLLNGLWSKPQIKVYVMPDVGISAFSMKLIKWKDTLSTCCLCNPFWN